MIKRIAAFLIALVLLVGMLPQAFAAEAAGNSIPDQEPIFAQPLVNTVADEYSVMALASKSGNTLTVTQTGTISESTVYSATRTVPSASNSTYCLWYMSGSSYQTTISLCSASTGSLNAYFKLKAVPQVGNICNVFH